MVKFIDIIANILDNKIDKLTVKKNAKEVASLQYVYNADGLQQIRLTGRADLDLSEYIKMVNDKFIERIGIIDEIDTINTIDTINQVSVVSPRKAATSVVTLPGVVVPSNLATVTKIVELDGAGTLLEASLHFNSNVVPTDTIVYVMQIWIDGVDVINYSNRDYALSTTVTSGKTAKGTYWLDGVADYQHLRAWLDLDFKSKIELYAVQNDGSDTMVIGSIVANLV